AEGDVVAFLEAEPLQNACDANGDGDIFDSILRVFRLGPTEVTAGMNLAVDAAPVVSGRSLAVSNGRVFFRRPEQAGAQQTTTRASVDSSGAQANRESFGIAVSADGRFVAFASFADNLVIGDTNGANDVFVRDRVAGTTTRLSVSSGGDQGNASSFSPSLSADGRFVTFRSYASNLVAADANGTSDVFVHDRLTGTTERVSVDSAGIQGNGPSQSPALSADGRFVAFRSNADNLVAGDTNGGNDVFVHDRVTGTTTRASVNSLGAEGNAGGEGPAISADGRWVAFESGSTNLVPGATNGAGQFFLHDRVTGMTMLVSVDSAGVQANANNVSGPAGVSADGRFVLFASAGTNLVPGATNGFYDLFVHGTDPTDCARDLTGDCDLADTGRQVLNAGTGALTPLRPAGAGGGPAGRATDRRAGGERGGSGRRGGSAPNVRVRP